MSFITLSPSDTPVSNSKSDTSDGNFGGNREYSQTADSKDYTKRTGIAPDKKENPEDTLKDIDDMTDPNSRKREFSYQEDLSNVQKGNESKATQSDSDRRPSEDTDGFEPDLDDPNFKVKRLRSKLKGQFGDGQYEGEIS